MGGGGAGLFDYLDFNCSQCVPNVYTWEWARCCRSHMQGCSLDCGHGIRRGVHDVSYDV